MIHHFKRIHDTLFFMKIQRGFMIHHFKRIHDTLFFMKIHDFSFLVSNSSHHKIINKTIGFYTLQNHVFNSITLIWITSLKLVPKIANHTYLMISLDPHFRNISNN